MKQLFTGKRMLTFVCALLMALGVSLHGTAFTAQAGGNYPIWGVEYDENGEAWPIGAVGYTDSLEESVISYQNVELLLYGPDWVAETDQVISLYIELGYYTPEKPTPYTPEQRVMNAAKQQLKEPKAATDSNKNKIISLGGYCALSNKMMKQVADTVSKGYNVAFQYKYEGKNYVVLIPAGAEVDTELEWAGPLYLASKYLDITDAYYAQSKKICPELRLQNVINGVVE